jgi:hypothetical protein
MGTDHRGTETQRGEEKGSCERKEAGRAGLLFALNIFSTFFSFSAFSSPCLCVSVVILSVG